MIPSRYFALAHRKVSDCALIVGAIALLAGGCAGGGNRTTGPNTPTTVAGIELSVADTAVLVGEDLSVVASVRSTTGAALQRTITWTSSNPSLAQVSQAGVITGIALGMVTITAAVDQVSKAFTVQVVEPSPFSGMWFLSEWTVDALRGVICSVEGSMPLQQVGRSLHATMTLAGTCLETATGNIVIRDGDVLVVGFSVDGAGATRFTQRGNPDCLYQGTASGTAQDSIVGNVSCDGLALNTDGTFTLRRTTPATGPTGAFSQINGGYTETCALTTAGKAHCWGGNRYGILGDGTLVPRFTPVPVNTMLTFTWIAVGAGHACGLDEDGNAHCWGLGVDGQLGTGDADLNLTPTAVIGGLAFTGLTASGSTSCGLIADGTLYCWGDNSSGQFGNGSVTKSLEPIVAAGGMKFLAVDLAESQICGIAVTGGAFCWGNNDVGGIGDGTTINRLVPTAVATGANFVSVRAGLGWACGIEASGTAHCWGWNLSGVLGVQSADHPRLTPSPVSGSHLWASMTMGLSAICGLTTAGVSYCWGENASGVVGDGTLIDRIVPTAVTGGPLAFIDAGFDHVCGLDAAGTAYCWGDNSSGQLGLGFAGSQQPTPTAVAGQ